MIQFKPVLDSQRRILKRCAECQQWKVANVDNFPVVNLKLDRVCCVCSMAQPVKDGTKRLTIA